METELKTMQEAASAVTKGINEIFRRASIAFERAVSAVLELERKRGEFVGIGDRIISQPKLGIYKRLSQKIAQASRNLDRATTRGNARAMYKWKRITRRLVERRLTMLILALQKKERQTMKASHSNSLPPCLFRFSS